ncbi:hypothetical protein N7539_002583 [Penicillium diatomitis]|uniref:PBSP domain-containing protein n=1 Tax=Penicillium diatomitis TaxID=2819901 RepID=A0A9W9XF08_9EURO|nr:uncharacterized protein N7539_002583 [Penicillium diatomitis]KAJ5491016.1 hypothetical protein N7539_002583 [Penicillium diatomitis]
MTTTAIPITSGQAPTESAIPKAVPSHSDSQTSADKDKSQDQRSIAVTVQPSQAKYRLHAEDFRHSGSAAFISYIPDVGATLDAALDNIIKYLYTSPARTSAAYSPTKVTGYTRGHQPEFVPSIPPTRAVTVFLRDFSGVAYTTGTELDNDHKEIHISLSYISHCKNSAAKNDPAHELAGVITHELVHCYQHTSPPDPVKDGKPIPGPPGGLIEGIADFVRLKAGLSPPHWTRPTRASEREKKWDAGYQHTAFFLAWIEDVLVGQGAIGMLNDRLLRCGYVGEEDGQEGSHQDSFWKGLFGMGVADLWAKYGEWLDNDPKTR